MLLFAFTRAIFPCVSSLNPPPTVNNGVSVQCHNASVSTEGIYKVYRASVIRAPCSDGRPIAGVQSGGGQG